MRLGALLAVVSILAMGAAAGCGSSSKSAGSEGGPCYGNGSCNSGLTCLSQLCVKATGTGGAAGNGSGGGAAAGATGAAGKEGVGGSGGGAGGTGGAGGMAPDCTGFTTPSQPCTDCLVLHCCAAAAACGADDGCMQCVQQGGGSECVGADTAFASLSACEGSTCVCPF